MGIRSFVTPTNDTGHVVMAGGPERLWVGDTLTGGPMIGRVTELSLDGTPLNVSEAALPESLLAPHARLVLPGAPLAAWWGMSGAAARVGFDDETVVTLSADGRARFSDAGSGATFVYGAELQRIAAGGTSSAISLEDAGVDRFSITLLPGDADGRGYGIGTTADDRMALLVYDFGASPPSLAVRDLELPTARIDVDGYELRGFAETATGYVVSAPTLEPGTLRTVWFDEDFVEVARHDQPLDAPTRVLGIVSGPYGELIVLHRLEPIGAVSALRVVVANASGRVRGGTRDLHTIIDGPSPLDTTVWSALDGSVSVAYAQGAELHVVTFCAPL